MNPLRALFIALLLIALPMQGIAAYAPIVACVDGHAAHGNGHKHDSASVDANAQDAGHDHHQSDNSPADPTGGHSCCHHVVSAAAPALISAPPEAPQRLVSRITLLNTLFIPELPQRPPRA